MRNKLTLFRIPQFCVRRLIAVTTAAGIQWLPRSCNPLLLQGNAGNGTAGREPTSRLMTGVSSTTQRKSAYRNYRKEVKPHDRIQATFDRNGSLYAYPHDSPGCYLSGHLAAARRQPKPGHIIPGTHYDDSGCHLSNGNSHDCSHARARTLMAARLGNDGGNVCAACHHHADSASRSPTCQHNADTGIDATHWFCRDDGRDDRSHVSQKGRVFQTYP